MKTIEELLKLVYAKTGYSYCNYHAEFLREAFALRDAEAVPAHYMQPEQKGVMFMVCRDSDTEEYSIPCYIHAPAPSEEVAEPSGKRSKCSDERPCVNCFSDQGECLDSRIKDRLKLHYFENSGESLLAQDAIDCISSLEAEVERLKADVLDYRTDIDQQHAQIEQLHQQLAEAIRNRDGFAELYRERGEELAALWQQEPVAVFSGYYGGRPTIDSLVSYVFPIGAAFYTAPTTDYKPTPQPKQEPVGFFWTNGKGVWRQDTPERCIKGITYPLYAAPQPADDVVPDSWDDGDTDGGSRAGYECPVCRQCDCTGCEAMAKEKA